MKPLGVNEHSHLMACLIAVTEFNVGPWGVRGVEENDQQLCVANNYSVWLEPVLIFTYAELISLYGKGNGITAHWRERKEKRQRGEGSPSISSLSLWQPSIMYWRRQSWFGMSECQAQLLLIAFRGCGVGERKWNSHGCFYKPGTLKVTACASELHFDWFIYW